jgi:uncharacterized membrane protein
MQNYDESKFEQTRGPASTINVGREERILSAVAAPVVAYLALKRGGITGFLLSIVAGELSYRSLTGQSPLYRTLGVNTAVAYHHADISVPHEQGIHIEKSVHIARPRSELYAFWHNLSNLPRFMPYLERVQELGERYSHWIAKGPLGVIRYHWDAEIINDVKDELIAWRTVDGSQIAHAGAVRFENTPNNLGTIVSLELEYTAPGGKSGALLASMLGISPEHEVQAAMEAFVTLMETGKLPSSTTTSEVRRQETERRADYVQMTSEDSFPASDPPASW